MIVLEVVLVVVDSSIGDDAGGGAGFSVLRFSNICSSLLGVLANWWTRWCRVSFVLGV